MHYIPLGTLCTINPPGDSLPEGTHVTFLPMTHISETGTIDPSETRTVADVHKGYRPFQEGDVLFAKITPCMENGKGAVAHGLCNGHGFGSTEFHILRPDLAKTTASWLYYLTAWQPFRKICAAHMTGSGGQRRVPAAFLQNYPVPDLPLPEQNRIISTLQQIDRLLANRRRVSQLLEALPKARFVEMFGDPGKNPKIWPIVPLKTLLTTSPQNGMYKPLSDYVSDDSGTPILRVDSFYEGKVTKLRELKRLRCNPQDIKKYALHVDDLVINRVNSLEYLGKCAHIDCLLEPTVYESNMMRFHLKENADPVYVTHMLCSRFVRNQISTMAKKAVNQASINQTDVQNIELPLPPLADQRRFAAFARACATQRAACARQTAALETLRAKLLQDAFAPA